MTRSDKSAAAPTVGLVLFREQHNAWIWLAVLLLGLSIILAREKDANG